MYPSFGDDEQENSGINDKIMYDWWNSMRRNSRLDNGDDYDYDEEDDDVEQDIVNPTFVSTPDIIQSTVNNESTSASTTLPTKTMTTTKVTSTSTIISTTTMISSKISRSSLETSTVSSKIKTQSERTVSLSSQSSNLCQSIFICSLVSFCRALFVNDLQL